MPRSIESRFVAGPEGVEDHQYHLVNKLEDIQNQCGRQYNQDQKDYWNLMKDKLKEFPEKDLDYLFHQYHLLGENGKKIRDTVQSIWVERHEERVKRDKEKQVKKANSKRNDDLRDAAKKAFEGTDFKNVY